MKQSGRVHTMLFIIIKLAILGTVCAESNFIFEHSWELFDYDIDGMKYTNDSDYEHKEGTFSFSNVALEDHEKFLIRKNLIPYNFISDSYRDIISMPRTRPGIPFTVNYFEPAWKAAEDSKYMLKPFPDSKTGKEITSVFGMTQDDVSRLWFVDTGYLDVPGVRKQIQPAALLLYENRKNPKLQFRKDIDTSLLHNGVTSGLRSISVDFIVPYSEVYVYITDETTGDLIVFSLQDMRFMKIYRESNGIPTFSFLKFIRDYMLEVQKYRHRPNETYEHYVDFLNSTNQLYDPKNPGERKIYNNVNYPNYVGYIYTKNFDGNILLFTDWNRTKLYCWNMDTKFNTTNVGLPASLKENDVRFAALDVSGTQLHGIIQTHLNSTEKLHEDEYNFFYFKQTVNELIEGTVCAKRNECTDFVERRSQSQALFFFGRQRPKYVADSHVKSLERLWNVAGVMN